MKEIPSNPSKAIEKAVDECIEEGVLVDILTSQRSEVLELALITFNRELYEQGLREEGAREAEARGKEKGEKNLGKLINALLDDGLDDIVRLVTTDKMVRDEYYKKYNIK